MFDISFKNAISPLITDPNLTANLQALNEYKDFTTNWYVDIGYQIWLNWLILSMIPHIGMPLYHILREKICLWLGRKKLLQKNLLAYVRGEEFEIEDHYANVMMIIFVGFSFAPGIPFMIILSWLGLITRYVYFKYVFIRFCRIPKSYNG